MPENIVLSTGKIVLALVVVLGFGHLGGVLARVLRQPPVVGECLFGLFLGPALIAMVHAGRPGPALPGEVTEALTLLAHAGLAWFLAGVAHELRPKADDLSRRAITLVSVGTLVPSALVGLLFAGWLRSTGDPQLLARAPWSAQLLMICLSMMVTAVPVLARIIIDRGLASTAPARLALTAAVIADTAVWLLLAVALGLASGTERDVVTAVGVLAAGACIAVLVRPLLRSERISRCCARYPLVTAVSIGLVALLLFETTAHAGLTGVPGAVLAGLAVPAGQEGTGWPAAVHKVVMTGRGLVPVYFVMTGLQVFSGPMPALPGTVTATLLAIAGKIGGGYLGARLGGSSAKDGLLVGVLVNTRGLTEIVVLQAGFTAGLLSPALFVALLLMALITTVITGPLLSVTGGRRATVQPGSVEVHRATQ